MYIWIFHVNNQCNDLNYIFKDLFSFFQICVLEEIGAHKYRFPCMSKVSNLPVAGDAEGCELFEIGAIFPAPQLYF